MLILLTSLPESWDTYTTSFFGSSGHKPDIKSHELIAVLFDEERRRTKRLGESSTALHAKHNSRNDARGTIECSNCRKKGHTATDCWSKGGGKEGQGPRGRKKGKKGGHKANQTEEVNSNLNDCAYMTSNSHNSHEISKNTWLLDSGTTSHICTLREAFTDFQTVTGELVKGIGQMESTVVGRGTVTIVFEFDGKTYRHLLRHTLFVPNAPNCLLSLSRFDDTGGNVEFRKGFCWMKDNSNKVVGKGSKHRRLYLLAARAIIPEQERANAAGTPKLTWDQWHTRYGHIGFSALKQLQKENLVNGLDIDQTSQPSASCEACIQAKQTHKSFPKEAENRSEMPGERVVSDVWGPARVTSIGEWRYYITFIDDAKRHCTILFLKQKSDASLRIKSHVAKVKRRFGKGPRWMRFDNGSELVNEEVRKFADEEGITIETTAPYSPSQNGIAERFNRSIMELVRAMLIAKNLPSFLWDEAASHAVYLRNRAPTRALDGMTPHEAWTGEKPDVRHFHEFGCDVWILDESTDRSKLGPRSSKMVFVGYAEGSKAIRYWDKATRKIKVSRNVTFTEGTSTVLLGDLPGILAEGETRSTPATPAIEPEIKSDQKIEPEIRNLRPKTRINYRQLNDPTAALQQPTNLTIRIPPRPSTPATPPDIARPTESSKAKTTEKANLAAENAWETTLEGDYSFITREADEPTYTEAMRGEEREEWKAAMDEEIGTLITMGTWDLQTIPCDRSPIGCRWVFLKKRDELGKVTCYKARLIAQGFSQKPGVDYCYDGTFAPVMCFETLHTLLTYATVHNLKL